MADKRRDLEVDDLVEGLRPDPNKPAPSVRMITGFLGPGGCEGSWRLYHTPVLDTYVEIDESDIVYTKSLSKKVSPLGGTTLFVKEDAMLNSVRASSADIQSEFLLGHFTESSLSHTSPQMPGGTSRLMAFYITLHTCWGGYTCKVYRGGKELHDTLETRCIYSLGFWSNKCPLD